MATEVIGFIGLGIMGKPMALNLMKAGHRLVVTSRSRKPVDEVVAAGATAAASPAEVAEARRSSSRWSPTHRTSKRCSPERTACSSAQARHRGHRHEHHFARRHEEARGGGAGKGGVDARRASERRRNRREERDADDHGRRRPEHVRTRPRRCSRAWASRRASPTSANPARARSAKLCNQICIGGALAGVSEAFALAQSARHRSRARPPGAARRLRRRARSSRSTANA